MKFDIAWVAIVLAMVFFYLRLAMLRGKNRRIEREETLRRMRQRSAQKASKKKSGASAMDAPAKKDEQWFRVASWPLAVVALLVIFLSFVLREGAMDVLVAYKAYWWYLTVVGVIGLAFSIK